MLFRSARSDEPDVFFAIRRDHVTLARAAKAEVGVNTVKGRVRAVEYQGTFVKVKVELPQPEASADDDFVAYVEEGAYFRDPLLPGQDVVASWRMDQMHVLSGGKSADLTQARQQQSAKEAVA